MRLLYVEDEMSMAKTIEALLRSIGYSFDSAYCGNDALDLAMENDYDLILLDIMLPDIDGFEVIDRLRQANIDTPVLVQTGLLDNKRKDDGQSLGVQDYLIKPFNRNDLVKAIERAAARSNPDSAVAKILEESLKQPSHADNDARQYRRFNTLKSGRVVWPSPFSCVILNMCVGGAAIRLPYLGKEVPDRFTLTIESSESEMRCEVCWRLGDKIGVKFLE